MIEALKAKVVDAKLQAADAARELAESRCRADADIARLQDELSKLRDRYDRSDCINCVLNSELLCALRSLCICCVKRIVKVYLSVFFFICPMCLFKPFDIQLPNLIC